MEKGNGERLQERGPCFSMATLGPWLRQTAALSVDCVDCLFCLRFASFGHYYGTEKQARPRFGGLLARRPLLLRLGKRTDSCQTPAG